MSTDANSSSPTQTISERRRANLEMAAQEAFPGTAQSELRVNFLDVLLAIAQGFSATNKQLDKFLVHTKNERICAIANCGQRFKRRDRSRDHIRVHLDDRPYACDGECGKPGCRARFHATSALNTHQRQCPYNCPRCGATVLLHNKVRHTKTKACLNAVATNGSLSPSETVD